MLFKWVYYHSLDGDQCEIFKDVTLKVINLALINKKNNITYIYRDKNSLNLVKNMFGDQLLKEMFKGVYYENGDINFYIKSDDDHCDHNIEIAILLNLEPKQIIKIKDSLRDKIVVILSPISKMEYFLKEIRDISIKDNFYLDQEIFIDDFNELMEYRE